MGIGKIVKAVGKKFGTKYEVYDGAGNFMGIEKQFVSPIKRSVDEDVAAFGRSAIFHYKTKLQEGYRIKDLSDNEQYYVNAKRSISLSTNLVLWSVFLLQINCNLSVYRPTMDIPTGDHPSEATVEMVQLFSNIPAYIQKKDWTMESMFQYGRDERGYETIIVPKMDIQKSDRITVKNKKYIALDIDENIRYNMLEIQAGVDTRLL